MQHVQEEEYGTRVLRRSSQLTQEIKLEESTAAPAASGTQEADMSDVPPSAPISA